MVTLDVTNGDVSDVRLYLVYDDVPVRLGVVEGDESSTFRVPVGQLHGGGEVRLAGRLVPSRQTFLSEPLVLDDGDRLKVRIEDNPNVSALQIRQR